MARPRKREAPPAPLIEAFLEMLTAERGAAKNTRDAYARDLGADLRVRPVVFFRA